MNIDVILAWLRKFLVHRIPKLPPLPDLTRIETPPEARFIPRFDSLWQRALASIRAEVASWAQSALDMILAGITEIIDQALILGACVGYSFGLLSGVVGTLTLLWLWERAKQREKQ